MIDNLLINKKKPLFFIPLMVTSKPVNVENTENQPMTYLELKELNLEDFSKLPPLEKTEGLIDLTVMGKRFSIPWILSKFSVNE